MKIGQLASKTGISIRMLRYYEEKGLIVPGRRQSGYRDYTDDHVPLIEKIKVLNGAGLTLDEIRPLLACHLSAQTQMTEPLCPALRQQIETKIGLITEEINRRKQCRQLLRNLLNPQTDFPVSYSRTADKN